MKNVLIVIGAGLGIYGMYLWIDSRNKNASKEDCGCGCSGTAANAGTNADAGVVVDTSMIPDVVRERYDSSFNATFHGRGQSYSKPVGSTAVECADAGAVTETVTQ